ncbi:TetR family transcriptional regulator [Kineosporia sp. NBRC 101731]|nr:TetR family transcriptional regulator [Kineosporia sp. NBRC 101731]
MMDDVSPEISTYHQAMAAQKRAAIIGAATGLFLRSGYAGTSLAKVAIAADVSKATLFKQFPTKAALFDAIVTDYWRPQHEGDHDQPSTGDLTAGLETVGRRYVALLTRPGMADLFRIVIAEAPRFPELGQTHFRLGKMPFFDSVRSYLEAERDSGNVELSDASLAATQFLGMIADFVLWPRMLLLDYSPSDEAMDEAVVEAARTMRARYATT